MIYTGKHINGKKIVKHTKTSEYYIISHPKEINILTGNACVKIKDVQKYNKNFIFQYYDENNKLRTILIGRKQVTEHIRPCISSITDEYGNALKVTSCYIIKIYDIFKYGREIEL